MSDLKMSDAFSLPVSTNMDLARITTDDNGVLWSAVPENLKFQCEAINSYDSHVEQIAKLERDVEMLRGALSRMTKHYCDLVNCGDAGNWDPELEYEVMSSRKALAATEPK